MVRARVHKLRVAVRVILGVVAKGSFGSEFGACVCV